MQSALNLDFGVTTSIAPDYQGNIMAVDASNSRLIFGNMQGPTASWINFTLASTIAFSTGLADCVFDTNNTVYIAQTFSPPAIVFGLPTLPLVIWTEIVSGIVSLAGTTNWAPTGIAYDSIPTVPMLVFSDILGRVYYGSPTDTSNWIIISGILAGASLVSPRKVDIYNHQVYISDQNRIIFGNIYNISSFKNITTVNGKNLSSPSGVNIDVTYGNLIITDTGNSRILVGPPNGPYIPANYSTYTAIHNDILTTPSYLAMDPGGIAYVTESNSIKHMDPTLASTGVVVSSFGGITITPGRLLVDATYRYVVDTNYTYVFVTSKVAPYNPVVIIKDVANTTIFNPTDVAISPDGLLFISDGSLVTPKICFGQVLSAKNYPYWKCINSSLASTPLVYINTIAIDTTGILWVNNNGVIYYGPHLGPYSFPTWKSLPSKIANYTYSSPTQIRFDHFENLLISTSPGILFGHRLGNYNLWTHVDYLAGTPLNGNVSFTDDGSGAYYVLDTKHLRLSYLDRDICTVTISFNPPSSNLWNTLTKMTASVACPVNSPTNKVFFYDNAFGSPLGSANIIGTQAIFNTTVLPIGTRTIYAAYAGNGKNEVVFSSTYTYTIHPNQLILSGLSKAVRSYVDYNGVVVISDAKTGRIFHSPSIDGPFAIIDTILNNKLKSSVAAFTDINVNTSYLLIADNAASKILIGNLDDNRVDSWSTITSISSQIFDGISDMVLGFNHYIYISTTNTPHIFYGPHTDTSSWTIIPAIINPSITSYIPSGICVDSPSNTMAVVDSPNSRFYAGPLALLTSWTTTTSVGGQTLSNPSSCTFNNDQKLYIVDRSNNRLTFGMWNGNYANWQSITNVAGSTFTALNGVSISPTGLIIVTEDHRVAYGPEQGPFNIGTGYWNEVKTMLGYYINGAEAVAVDNSNVVYTASKLDHQIVSGPVYGVGTFEPLTGVDNIPFISPSSVIFDRLTPSIIIISDVNSSAIYYGPKSAAPLTGFTVINGSISGVNIVAPYGLASDVNGLLVFTDIYLNCVFWGPKGGPYGVGSWNIINFAINGRNLSYPTAVAVDTLNKLYISDKFNHRIIYGDRNAPFYDLPYWTEIDSVCGSPLSFPGPLIFDKFEVLYVADTEGSRIIFGPTYPPFRFSAFDLNYWKFFNFTQPTGVSTDTNNAIITTDSIRNYAFYLPRLASPVTLEISYTIFGTGLLLIASVPLTDTSGVISFKFGLDTFENATAVIYNGTANYTVYQLPYTNAFIPTGVSYIYAYYHGDSVYQPSISSITPAYIASPLNQTISNSTGYITSPTSSLFDFSGYVWCSDLNNGVSKFYPNLTYITTWNNAQLGAAPWHIAVDANLNILVGINSGTAFIIIRSSANDNLQAGSLVSVTGGSLSIRTFALVTTSTPTTVIAGVMSGYIVIYSLSILNALTVSYNVPNFDTSVPFLSVTSVSINSGYAYCIDSGRSLILRSPGPSYNTWITWITSADVAAASVSPPISILSPIAIQFDTDNRLYVSSQNGVNGVGGLKVQLLQFQAQTSSPVLTNAFPVVPAPFNLGINYDNWTSISKPLFLSF